MKLVKFLRLTLAGLALVFVLGLSPYAQAQHRGRRGYYDEEQDKEKKGNSIPYFLFIILGAPTVYLAFRGIKKG